MKMSNRPVFTASIVTETPDSVTVTKYIFTDMRLLNAFKSGATAVIKKLKDEKIKIEVR